MMPLNNFNMDRQKYLDAVKANVEPNIFNHSLALEACMLGLYDYFKLNNILSDSEPTREEWGLAGLIHDIDFAGGTKEQHPLKTLEVLAKYGLDISDSIHQIILAHDGRQGITMDSKAKWTIFCADSLTGLIMAVAYVYPDRKLASVKVSSVVKRFLKEPKFAAGTRRLEVAECVNLSGLNLPLEKFIEICLISMQKISSDLGL
jgi:predicted hydrolase (HD superfamily)